MLTLTWLDWLLILAAIGAVIGFVEWLKSPPYFVDDPDMDTGF